MALISITRLRVRSIRYLPQFIWYALRSKSQAQRAAGCLAVSVLREANNTYWTNTAWQDEAAMRSFMLSGSHRRVMPKLKQWCDEAAIVHWEQEGGELPDWMEAHQRMVQEGRRSKVNHPSAAHEAFEIPEPRV